MTHSSDAGARRVFFARTNQWLRPFLWVLALGLGAGQSAYALTSGKSQSAVTDTGGNVFQVTYTLTVTHDGVGGEYFDVQMFDDLTAEFGTPQALIGDVNAPGEYFVSVGAVDTSGVIGGNTSFAANGSYDGSGANTGILDVASNVGTLQNGDVLSVPITVTFFPDPANAPYTNTFTAAIDSAQNNVADSETTDSPTAITLDIVSSLSAFSCSTDLYVGTGNPTQLNTIGIGTNNLNAIGSTTHGVGYNGLGYRESNDLMYGIALGSNDLVVVDANGSVVQTGAISGLPSDNYPSGTFIADTMYVIRLGTNELYAIDVDALTATLVGSGTALADVFDIALNPLDGQLYGIRDGSEDLVRINPANAATTVIGNTGLGGVGIGGAYFDNVGNMYAYQNSDGRLYHIDVATGSSTVVFVGPTQTLSTGASCPSAGSPLPPLVGAALESVSVTDQGSNVFQAVYNLHIENSAFAGLYDIQGTLDLSTQFDTPVGSIGAVDAPGEYFASVGTIDTSGITNGDTTFSGNPAFTGSGGNTSVLVSGQTGSLFAGEKIVVPVTVTFFPDPANAPYDTQFTASADAAFNGTEDGDATDLSTTGTDPDQNGTVGGNDNNNDPTDTDSPTEIDLVPTLTTFACTNDLYLALNNPSQLNRVDFPTDSFVAISDTTHAVTHNGLGYHQPSNLLYALRFATNELLAIDANGTIAAAGSFSGLPATNYGAGDFIGDDYYLLSTGTNQMYRADMTTMTATLVGSGTALTDVFEMAANPIDGLLYGVRDGTREVVSIDPANATTTTLGTAAIGGSAIDAAFFDNQGNFYVYQSSDGGLYLVDPATGAATLLVTGNTSTLAGGASCSAAPPPGVPEIGAAANLVSVTDLGTTYELVYDLRIENTGTVAARDIQAVLDLSTNFGTAETTAVNVDTAGEFFAEVTSIDTAGITNGGNTTFAADGTYTGEAADTDLLDAAQSGSLNGGDFVIVRVTVTVFPDVANNHQLQFTGTADFVANGTADADVSDLSTTGTDVDLNGDIPGNDSDGDPSNTDSFTLVAFPDTDGDTVEDPFDADDDNDGIPDATEGDTTTNTDGDAVPDSRDVDSDGDGIPDNVEAQAEGSYTAPTNTDTDGDGLDDAYDTDNGGTAIVLANTDGADTADYIDTDSDNDGILDAIEGHDADADGVADVSPAAADADGDGLDDNFDTVAGPAAGNATGSNAPLQNTDGANERDWRDDDDDGDGVATSTEGGVGNDADSDGTPDYLDADDFDGDGVPDTTDLDNDADGIPDAVEGAGNTDGDALSDSFDVDSDGDGIPDNIEAQAEGAYIAPTGNDTDNDGLDDAYDTDNGGTAIVPVNTDGADTADYIDTDADNDGILDAVEGHDADRDGVADTTPSAADTDGDGLDDAYDNVVAPAAGNSAGSNAPLQNSDAAGSRDWRDNDDDGDGVDTATEGGAGNDADGDGTPDYLDADDVDGDGVPDSVDLDNDNDGLTNAQEGTGDSDGDGITDDLDIDSDGDGVPDNVEAQTDAGYVAPTGNDTDSDGLDDAYDADNGGTPITPVNSDGADQPDYLDTDSDNDNVPDLVEANDPDGDGQANPPLPTGTDADNDGLDDAFDTFVAPGFGNAVGTNAAAQNTDGADTPDYRDADDDNDGTNTVDEDPNGNSDPTDDDSDLDGTPDYLDDAAVDSDGDGIADAADGDADNDGILDIDEGNGTDPSADADGDGTPNFQDPDLAGFTDSNGDGVNDAFDADGDGVPNHLDIDSDNDGVPDNIEAQGGTGTPPSGTDADTDGIDDAYDPSQGGTPIVVTNTDGTDQPDYLDNDADNDGVPDATEAHDTDMDGVADTVATGTDSDGDGLDDAFDTVAGPGAGNSTGSNAALNNTDGTDQPDYLDTDEDNDGVPTADEDTNGDGNFANDDADSDGLPDYLDAVLDIAELSGTVFLDRDSNGQFGGNDTPLETWVVELLQNDMLLATTTVAADGSYTFADLIPGAGYLIRLRHPVTNATFELISGISLNAGDNLLDQNLPVDPSGVVYSTDGRVPLAGATVTAEDTSGAVLPDACFLPGQQGQVTDVDGVYKLDLQVGADAACPSGTTIAISVTAPDGFNDAPSTQIDPAAGPFDPTGLADPVQVQTQETPPQIGDDTTYYLSFVLESGDPDVIHNHIPLDPVGSFDVRITKTTSKRTASVGDLVPYEIEVRNVGTRDIVGLTVSDTLPNGFRMVDGSIRVAPEMTSLTVTGEKPVNIGGIDVAIGERAVIRYFLRVGAGVVNGEYINTASASLGAVALGNAAQARIEVVSDPDFEQTTIIGKVFDDRDGDGWQDAGEPGIPGVRLATVTGLLIETDAFGRYHIAGVDVSRFERGQNFYLKLDKATLPDGTEMVSENPRVMRITQGLMNQINFAVRLPASASLQTVEVGEVFFTEGSTRIRDQHKGLLDDMAAHIRRYEGGVITILARAGSEALAVKRANALKSALMQRLGSDAPAFTIEVKTEVHEAAMIRSEGDVVRINEDIFFDTDSHAIRAQFVPVIEALARQIREACGGEVTIEGHADKRGNAAYNQALSERRTASVKNALEKAGAFEKAARDCADQAAIEVPVTHQGTKDREGGFMKSLLYRAFAGLVSTMVPMAHADEVDPCQLSYCATDEGVVVRILSKGEQAPRTEGDSQSALQDGRRVSVRGEVTAPGGVATNPDSIANRADVTATTRVRTADGSTLWLTEDPLRAERKLAFATPTVAVADGSVLRFPFYSNYAAFQDHLVMTFYRGDDLDRGVALDMLKVDPSHVGSISWKPKGVLAGDEVQVVLRAYDADGAFDETRVQKFVLLEPTSIDGKDRQRMEEQAEKPHAAIYGRNDLAIERMPLAASQVRLHGDVRGVKPQISIDGEQIPLDGANRFAVEYLLPMGEHNLNVAVSDNGEQRFEEKMTANVSGRYIFLAGFADITASDNNLSGNVETISSQDAYDDSFNVDGRLAFYLKGKVKGKYLMTAQLDTRETELSEVFSGIMDKDPDALFRRLDPDRYYPVYGDDSTTVADVNTMGRMYVRVDWDQSQMIWGNYNTSFTGTEFAQYNRSLYGAMLNYNANEGTELGDSKTQLKAFASKAQTAYGHAEFLGTGGSLYYLPHTDILPGSEKVYVEVRDRDSNRIVERITMARGQDYDVDEIQGRIILSRPLAQVRSRAVSIIRHEPLDGDETRLLVDYEYVPTGFDPQNVTWGARGKKWLGDHFAIGATHVTESRGSEDYTVDGVDLTLQKGRGTYLKLEYADTEASQSNGFYSDNGGMSFAQQSNTNAENRDGNAIALEGRANFQELGISDNDWTVGFWWRDSDRDFSVARFDTGSQDLRESGVEVTGHFNERLGMTLRRSAVERGSVEDNRLSGMLDYQVSSKDRLRVEIQELENRDTFTGVDTEETVAAAELAHAFSERFEMFAGFQLTLDQAEGEANSKDMMFIGTRNRITDKLRLETEATSGQRGEGLSIGIDYARTDRHSLYGTWTRSTDTTYAPGGGDRFTVGNRFRISNQTTIFTENQFVHDNVASGFTHSYGMDYAPAPGWDFGLSVQKGELDASSGLVDRSTGTISAGYQNDGFRWRTTIEMRRDDGAERRDQMLSTNRMEVRASDSLRVLGKYNVSRTDDNNAQFNDARFEEAGIGLAYRPVGHDRFNMLMKWIYLYDLGSAGQFSASTDQKSQIATIEGVLRLSPQWKFAAKYGYRDSELRADRSSGDWFESTVDFASARFRYHLLRKWEAIAEYRRLEVRQDDSVKDGFLIGVDRHMNDNIKLGIGYNWADFSDDLRILDYDQKGWFFNIVGKI